MTPTTITTAIEDFLHQESLRKKAGTVKAYRMGLGHFQKAIAAQEIDPLQESVTALEDTRLFLHFIAHLQGGGPPPARGGIEGGLSPSTQRLYVSAALAFYRYLDAWQLAKINLTALTQAARTQVSRSGYRLPQFPKDDIEKTIAYAQDLRTNPAKTEREHLANLRDCAFILTLADTGLRVHEACALKRGDIDWHEGRAIIIGKGDKQAVVRFSERALAALKTYLQVRQVLDGAAGRQLSSLPLFSRHDKRSGKKIRPISTETGRNIVKLRVREALGEEAVGTITPHSFRHYFVTTVLQATGGNIHVAQKLARHSTISVTERYAHLADDELDQAYYEVFDKKLGYN